MGVMEVFQTALYQTTSRTGQSSQYTWHVCGSEHWRRNGAVSRENRVVCMVSAFRTFISKYSLKSTYNEYNLERILKATYHSYFKVKSKHDKKIDIF